jgi:hypothetical protein
LQTADNFARTLSDAELLDKCVQGFKRLRELIPYLREARRRWAQPGRRVPVPGRPCWTEWITQNLHVTPRRVRQLLSEPEEVISASSKVPRLSKGDWHSLFALTERQMAKVFGPLKGDAMKWVREINCKPAEGFVENRVSDSLPAAIQPPSKVVWSGASSGCNRTASRLLQFLCSFLKVPINRSSDQFGKRSTRPVGQLLQLLDLLLFEEEGCPLHRGT